MAWAKEIKEFVTGCYYPDALAIMGAYKDYFDIGQSSPNFLAVGMAGTTYGGSPLEGLPLSTMHRDIKPGVIMDGDYSRLQPLDPEKIQEFISSAWYSYDAGNDQGLHPRDGETTVNYDGPQPPYEWLGDNQRYTWSKAPRYDGRPMQMGPIARVLVAYLQKEPHTTQLVNEALDTLDIELPQLNSTGGRTLARAVEAYTSSLTLVEDLIPRFIQGLQKGDTDVFDSSKWEPKTWDKHCQGFAMMEVARGCLSHWVTIDNRTVSNYQAVVPTTWLSSGRDPQGTLGPYEQALAGTGKHPLKDSQQPLEILRTIHSFDPCMSCAVHVLDPEGTDLFQVVTP